MIYFYIEGGVACIKIYHLLICVPKCFLQKEEMATAGKRKIRALLSLWEYVWCINVIYQVSLGGILYCITLPLRYMTMSPPLHLPLQKAPRFQLHLQNSSSELATLYFPSNYSVETYRFLLMKINKSSVFSLLSSTLSYLFFLHS